MAETKEKRADDATSENTTNNDNKNLTNSSTQTNTQTGVTGAGKNSADAQNTNKSGSASSSETPGAKEILAQAKETAGQAYEKVSEQASSKIETQKDNLARGLSSVADGIRQMGENLRGDEQQTPIADLTARYGESLASRVEDISNYLEKKDLGELVKDVEVFARRNPAVFIGGAFALGILAARFLKSGNPNQALMRRPRRNRAGFYIPDESEGVYLPEDLSRKVGLTDATEKTSDFGSTGASQRNIGNSASSTGMSGTPTDKTTTTSGAASTTDRTSTDAFSTNKGG